MRVSEAKPTDILRIIDLLMDMHDEAKELPFGKPNRARISNALSNCIKFVVHDDDDTLCGILALREGPWWFSTQSFLGDLVFYVSPGYRASPAASLLLRRAKEYARERSLPLMMSIVHPEDQERKRLFFLRHGFSPAGHSFYYKD